MSISIIIPVYNEEECIKECLTQVNEAFHNIDYEIIIVNDGSTDKTHQIISSIIKEKPAIKYIFYRQNKGYSYAIKEGVKKARKDYVSFIDADLQYPPKELLKMHNHAKNSNIEFLIGIPIQKRKYYNPIRKIMSFFYNIYVSFLFGIKLKDPNSLKLMKRKYLEKINFLFGYGMIEIETLLGFKMQGISINTYPINVRERFAGKSKCSLKIIYRTIIDCAKLRFLKNTLIKKNENQTKYYYKHIENYDWTKIVDKFRGPETFFHRTREKAMIKLIKKYGEGDRYLDAGCGTGLILRHLPKNSVGLDLNPRNLEKAKKYAPKARLLEGDIEAMSFPDKSFSTVICSEVLEHLLYPQKAVKEIKRVLKPGGILIGSVPKDSFIWKLRFLSCSRKCFEKEPYHKHYRREEIEKLLSPLKIIRISSLIFMNWLFVTQKDI